MKRWLPYVLLLAALSVASDGGSCGPPMNQDPYFDLWCGDTLCAWDVEEGEIRRVSTWHRSDYGVSLEGERAALSQTLDSGSVDCFVVSVLVDRASSVSLTLEVDYLDDGIVEFEAPLENSRWEEVVLNVWAPSWDGRVRFRVRKVGDGRAVLAQLEIVQGEGCGAPPNGIGWPLAAPCEADTDCESGTCASFVPFPALWPGEEMRACSVCRGARSCSVGQACGLEPHELRGHYLGCGPPGRHALGERCQFDLECATGRCCDGMCSTCCGAGSCADDETCGKPALMPADALGNPRPLPQVCEPSGFARAKGEPCLVDADCASASCDGDGPLHHCGFDGRLCETSADCKHADACLPLGEARATCR